MKKRFCVAILFNIAIFTEFKIYSEEKEFSSLSAVCQFKSAKYSTRIGCAGKCGKFRGVFILGTTQLVCFHDSEEASLIFFIDKETNKRQCGYVAVESSDYLCKPITTCEYETEEECLKKCSKYTVYFRRINKYSIEVLYCGETIKMNPRTIDYKATQHYSTREDGTQWHGYDCSCGIGEEGTEVLEPLRTRTRQLLPYEDARNELMVASCPKIFLKFNRGECSKACGKLNGMFSREDNKFICFQNNVMDVTGFRATAEYCECWIDVDYRLQTIKCPPERRIRLNTEAEGLDCPEKCANYKAYEFFPSILYSSERVIYCELPSYIFGNLSYKIGNTKVVDNKSGNKKYRKYECTCGLRLSQSEINSKINTFLTNDEGNEVKNNPQTINHFEVRSNEKQISDSQMHAELHIQNERIDDLVDGSDFLYGLLHDDEYQINHSNDFSTPRVGDKRTSHRMSLRDEEEINRGKNKGYEFRMSDKIVQPTDLEIPSMSCHHTTSLNNTQIAGSSSSNIPKRDPNLIQIDEGTFRNLFAGASSPPIRNTLPNRNCIENDEDLLLNITTGDFEHPSITRQPAPTQNNINGHKESGSSQNSSTNSSTRISGRSQNTSLYNYTVVGQSVSQTRGLLTQQSMAVGPNMLTNTQVGQSVLRHRGLTTPLSNELSMGIGQGVSQNRGLITPRSMGLGRNVLHNTEVSQSVSQNRGFITPPSIEFSHNTSANRVVGQGALQNRGLIASRSMGLSRNMLQNRRVGGYQSRNSGPAGPICSTVQDDNISRRSLSTSPSFLFPNATLEINENYLDRVVGDFDPPLMSGHHTPFLNNIINDNEESVCFYQRTVSTGDTSQYISHDSSMLENRQLICNTSKNTGPFNYSNIMLTNNDNTFGDTFVETRFSPIWGEDNISLGSSSDPMSFLFPNVTMEINEVIRPL